MKLSIIIPVFNAESYLRKCLDSILAAQLDDYEIICINDGSTDNTPTILDEYKTISNVKILRQKNKGSSVSKNLGISVASGDFLLFADSDDYVISSELKCVYDLLNKADYDLYIFGRMLEYAKKKIIPYHLEDIFFTAPDEYFQYAVSNKTFRTQIWDKLFKRAIIERHHISFRDIRIGEDCDFLLRYLLCVSKIRCVDSIVYVYNQTNTQSLTKSFGKNDIEILNYLPQLISLYMPRKEYSYIMLIMQRFLISALMVRYNNTQIYVKKKQLQHIVAHPAFQEIIK